MWEGERHTKEPSLTLGWLAGHERLVYWVSHTNWNLVPTRHQGDIKWHLFEKCVFDCFLRTGSSSGRLKVFVFFEWFQIEVRFACQVCAPHVTFSRNCNAATPWSKSNDFYLLEKKTVIVKPKKEDKRLVQFCHS